MLRIVFGVISIICTDDFDNQGRRGPDICDRRMMDDMYGFRWFRFSC